MITPADLMSLRSLLTPLRPEARRTFALACARHALAALPADPTQHALQAALDDPVAAHAGVLAHPWSLHSSGHARYMAWQSAYWASWPSLALSTWVAEQAAWYAQMAAAEQAERPGLYQLNAAAEARWQRAQLTAPTPILPALPEMEAHQ